MLLTYISRRLSTGSCLGLVSLNSYGVLFATQNLLMASAYYSPTPDKDLVVCVGLGYILVGALEAPSCGGAEQADLVFL
jgi:hypothetical protein